jgi:hypothetical protein
LKASFPRFLKLLPTPGTLSYHSISPWYYIVSVIYWAGVKPENHRYLSYREALALQLTFGGMCMLPQHRGGARFCTRGTMQDYDVVLFILAMAKTVTPGGGPRREPGRAVAPATELPL